MKISTIIFDLGGVLVELDFSIFNREIISKSPLKRNNKKILNKLWKKVEYFDKGNITEDEFYRIACQELKIDNLSKFVFFNSFISILKGGIDENIAILEKLRNSGRFKLIALSNVNKSHWEYGIKSNKFQFLKYFDEIIVSHEVKMIKPEIKIFEFAIQKAKCKPEEIIFIDDGKKNIRAAKKLGINAILYKNNNDLINKFKKLGINLE